MNLFTAAVDKNEDDPAEKHIVLLSSEKYVLFRQN